MTRGSSRQVAALGLLIAAMALAFAGAAEAKLIRKPLGPFGSAEQQSFASTFQPKLAVDQDTHELYVLSGGPEEQLVKVSATAGTFRLKFNNEPTADIAFGAPSGQGEGKPGSVQAALEALPSIGAGNVGVREGPGDATGSKPYHIQFVGALLNTDLDQLTCENGTPPLSGGSGCSVTTKQEGEPIQVTRWNADGTPSNFSALGSNAIDGQGPGEDQTPDNTLEQASYIAIDESGGATDGDIYITRGSNHAVDVFASSGKYLGQLTGFREGPNAEGPLKLFSADPTNRICGVTVDEAGDLYVGEIAVSGGVLRLSIHKYHPAANPVANADNVANFSVSPLNSLCFLTAGSGPTAGYTFSSGSPGGGNETELYKLDSTSGEKKSSLTVKEKVFKGEPPVEVEEVVPLRPVRAVAVDPATGYVLAGTSSQVLEYDASGSEPPLPRLSFGAGGEVTGLAADATSGNLYVARHFIPQIDVYGPALIIPDVTTEAATEVTGTSATLNGTIKAAGGPDSSCHFQYTTEAAYLADTAIEGHDGFSGASSAPCEPAGPFSGAATNAVSAQASPLSPEAKYKFRLLGENVNGENQGEAEGFETLGKPMIEGGLASEITTTTAQISGKVNPRGLPSTFAVQYLTQAEFEASGYAGATTTPEKPVVSGSVSCEGGACQQLTGLKPFTTYHFRLIAKNEAGVADPGEDGTFTTFVEPGGLPDGRAYEMVSPPQKLGEVYPPYDGPSDCFGCTPGFFQQKMAMQSSPEGNAVAYIGAPFSGGQPSGANEYLGNRGSGGWGTTPISGPQFTEGGLREGFRAFSADLSRGVIRQESPVLSPDAPPGYANLYAWRAGEALRPLITEAPPNRPPDGLKVTYAGANAGTPSSPAFEHVVFEANDALTAEEPGIAPQAPAVTASETDLYEWSEGQLHLVNVLPGNNAAAANAVIGSGALLTNGADTYDFDHAISEDGSRIFWSALPSGQLYVREAAASTTKVTDPGKFLTAAADGSMVLLSNGHVFSLEDESTVDLTEGQGGFQGILGTSEDLSRVYFVDTKALTSPGEENANGEAAEEGEFNLYLAEEGSTTFIGILSGFDDYLGPYGTWHASSGSRKARVSPDGRYLAFESVASLTGYDNRYRNAQGDQGCSERHGEGDPPCSQVFEYDAVQDSLNCASCNPTGQRPLGSSYLAVIRTIGNIEPFRQPHNLPDEGEGRLFFESLDTLSAADKNGSKEVRTQDVYQWEPEGIGSCELPGGCISLISNGQGPTDSHAFNEDSYFVDASASGDDVFFTTWNQLVPQDKDDFMDLYDARVGGGFEFSAQEPCLGEACRGAGSSAPEQQSPGTAGFSEAVSKPKAGCKKGSVKKRGRCVSKKKKKHHHKRAAKHNRGGAR